MKRLLIFLIIMAVLILCAACGATEAEKPVEQVNAADADIDTLRELTAEDKTYTPMEQGAPFE